MPTVAGTKLNMVDTNITRQQAANISLNGGLSIVWPHSSKGVTANIEQARIGSNSFKVNQNGDGIYVGNSIGASLQPSIEGTVKVITGLRQSNDSAYAFDDVNGWH